MKNYIIFRNSYGDAGVVETTAPTSEISVIKKEIEEIEDSDIEFSNILDLFKRRNYTLDFIIDDLFSSDYYALEKMKEYLTIIVLDC